MVSVMNSTVILVKIQGIPKNVESLSFGQQIPHLRTIAEFKQSAKSTHLSQKRQSYKTALREFLSLHPEVKEYFAKFLCGSDAKDDSFELFYK